MREVPEQQVIATGLPAALSVAGTVISCDAGVTVFHAGQPARSVYFLVSGSVRLVRYGRAGEEVSLHEARPGEFFAEASLDSDCYHCDAIANESSELLQFLAPAMRNHLASDVTLSREWMALLARQLRTARTRVERLSLKNVAERIRHLLYSEGRGDRCEVTLPGTFKELARELGLSHEALYRTLATMVREGIIEREGMTLRFKESASRI